MEKLDMCAVHSGTLPFPAELALLVDVHPTHSDGPVGISLLAADIPLFDSSISFGWYKCYISMFHFYVYIRVISAISPLYHASMKPP